MNNIVGLIACVDNAGGIGKDSGIPWKSKEDMKFFRETTQNSVCIMGRTTFESITKFISDKTQPLLKNRFSVVVSNSLVNETASESNVSLEHYPHVVVVRNIIQALTFSQSHDNYYNTFFIGGTKIYQESEPYLNKIYLNEISGDYDCDTFFPKTILGNFEHIKSVVLADSPNLVSYEYSRVNEPQKI